MAELLPSTPVLVGVGAVSQRFEEVGTGAEPVALMVAALQRAARDAGSGELLLNADRIEVPRGLWSYSNPARLVAQQLGAGRATTVLAEIGILQQSLLSRACNSIADGSADIVLITGAEAKYRALRGQIAGIPVSETVQTDDPPDCALQPAAELWSTVESDAGLGMPVGYYAILDSALRAALGQGVDAHRDEMALQYQRYSEIAADNEDAWVREPVPAALIREGAAGNRMLAHPYTRLHNSQWNVDQAAGLIFCSVAKATELGIPRERWVFPLAATESNAMSVVSARRELHRSHGFHLAGERLFSLAGCAPAQVGLMEIYSCFPQAVRVQMQEMGLPPGRDLSVTGAMTFAGGPLNNFVFQATVKMVQRLRAAPAEKGLVTCVSGMNTKQACALYSTTPNPSGWCFEDVTEAVTAATDLCELVADFSGPGRIAGYTVLYQGDEAQRAVAVCDIAGERRTVAFNEEPAVMAALETQEFCGRAVTLETGRFVLS